MVSARQACRGLLVLTLLGSTWGSAGAARAADCAERLRWVRMAAAAKRPMRAEDLIELRDFGPSDSIVRRKGLFSLSPDGRSIALLLRRANVAANSYCYGLVVTDLASGVVRLLDVGGEPILWTIDFRGQAEQGFGAIKTEAPLWSPDGRSIAYLRRDGGRTRLWRVPLAGGNAQPLPTIALDVRRFAWTADGSGLVYEVRPRLAAAKAAIAEEGRSGYLYDTRFAPLFGNAPSAPPDTPTDFRVVALEGTLDRPASDAERERLVPPPVPGSPPKTSVYAAGPGGSAAWVAPSDPDAYSGAMPLTAQFRRQVLRCAVAACREGVVAMWWQGADQLLFLRDWGMDRLGALELFRWRRGGAPVSILHTRDALIDCQLGQEHLYCARESSGRPRFIARVSLRDGTAAAVFDPNPEFAGVALGSVRRFAVHAADGAPSFADLVLPPEHRPGQRHPMVVVQYQSRGFLRGGVGDEYPIYLLAARGYAVLSYQRPMSFADDHKAADLNAFQRINTQDFADRRRVFTALEAAVDAAIATGTVDRDKLGITGLSEGASSAIWAILSTHRYRAAAVSSCCEDPYPSFYGNGLAFAEAVKAWGYPLPDADRQGFWRIYSLALGARRVTTPLLLQMSDQEYRYALQGVGSLKDAGKPVELYVFPNEFHDKWQPAHRAAVYARAIDWFDFWLLGKTDPVAAKAAQYARWSAMRSANPVAAQ